MNKFKCNANHSSMRPFSIRGLCVILILLYAILVSALLLFRQCVPASDQSHPISDWPSKFQPTIYILTATYRRPEQITEIIRMCHTLLHVPNIHWLLVEDANTPSLAIQTILFRCGISFTILAAKTPQSEKQKPNEPRWRHARGVAQRNLGLRWLRENLVLSKDKGILYIADDDNTYSLRLFDEIRSTRRASTWPVAFAGRLPWEGCVTDPNQPNLINKMWSIFKPWRAFPIDMAGFAVNIDLVLANPMAEFSYHPMPGLLETDFLNKLGLHNFTELEPKADGCTRLLVWHTIVKTPELFYSNEALAGKVPQLHEDEI